MTLTPDEAIEYFVAATDAASAGRDEVALGLFERVLGAHGELGVDVIASDQGELPRFMSLLNVAIVQQRLQRWEAMLERTSDLVAERADLGPAWRLHACAVKHTRGLDAGLEVMDALLAREPDDAAHHHERACILTGLGRLDEAVAACASALDHGSSSGALLADQELAPLFERPDFAALVTPSAEVARLLARLKASDAALDADAVASPDGSWMMTEETVERMDRALELVAAVLTACDLQSAPRRPHGEGQRVDLEACDPLQREVVETLVGCARLWHALPILGVFREHDLPSFSAAEARVELRMFDVLEPWVQPLRRALANPDSDLDGLLEVCDRLLEHHPGIAELWMSRGLIRTWLGEHEPAIADHERALVIDPDMPELHANRAVALVHLGQLDEALDGVVRAVELAPRMREWALSDPNLGPLRDRSDFASRIGA